MFYYYSFFYVPIDKRALASGVVADKHDVDLFSRCQQIDAHIFGNMNQAVFWIRVYVVAVSKDPLIGGHACVVAVCSLCFFTNHFLSKNAIPENRMKKN